MNNEFFVMEENKELKQFIESLETGQLKEFKDNIHITRLAVTGYSIACAETKQYPSIEGFKSYLDLMDTYLNKKLDSRLTK